LAISGAVSELSNEFLERMIRHKVDGCEIASFAADTTFDAKSRASDVVKIEVTHADPDCGPHSLIIKFPKSGYRGSEFGIYRREADIFHLLREEGDLAVPEMHGVESGDNPSHVVIVLEEITDARTVSPDPRVLCRRVDRGFVEYRSNSLTLLERSQGATDEHFSRFRRSLQCIRAT